MIKFASNQAFSTSPPHDARRRFHTFSPELPKLTASAEPQLRYSRSLLIPLEARHEKPIVLMSYFPSDTSDTSDTGDASDTRDTSDTSDNQQVTGDK